MVVDYIKEASTSRKEAILKVSLMKSLYKEVKKEDFSEVRGKGGEVLI
jgi:hypothetical protein